MPAGVALDAMSAWRHLLPSWPWVIGIAALLRALGSPAALLHDPDTYLHIAAGRWMLTQWALPATDPFSYTFAGTHWVAGEWLGEVAFAAAYGYAGWGGVIVLTAAGFAAAIGLLTRFLLRRLDPLPALIATLAGATLLLPHLLARPHVLALPFLVAWCGALLGRAGRGAHPAMGRSAGHGGVGQSPWQLHVRAGPGGLRRRRSALAATEAAGRPGPLPATGSPSLPRRSPPRC